MAGDVDGLADEEESGNFFRLHRLGGEFLGVDAPRGDFGFVEAFIAGGVNGPVVQ
jgi:hypothetical protein